MYFKNEIRNSRGEIPWNFRLFPNLNHSSSGFTLMEVLVAVMLLAISLTIIIQQFSMGLKNVSLAESYTMGIMYARNIMEESLINPTIQPGVESGEIDEDFKWERTVAEILPEAMAYSPNSKEFEIRVKVIWNYGVFPKDVELAALKVVKK